MISTVATVVYTHNLAIGVMVGVLLSGVFFAWKISQIVNIRSSATDDGRERTYVVTGQIFYASADDFVDSFDFREVLERVYIDVSRSHFWDISAVAALDKVVLKFRREGTTVELFGMNEATATIVDKLAIHDDPDAIDLMSKH